MQGSRTVMVFPFPGAITGSQYVAIPVGFDCVVGAVSVLSGEPDTGTLRVGFDGVVTKDQGFLSDRALLNFGGSDYTLDGNELGGTDLEPGQYARLKKGDILTFQVSPGGGAEDVTVVFTLIEG